MKVLLRISHMTLKYRWRVLGVYFFVLGATIFYLAIPRIVGMSVDSLLTDINASQLVFFASIVLVLSIMRGIFSYFQSYLSEWLSQKVAFDLRNIFFDKLQRLSFAYHDTQQTGDLMSKATSDIEAVRWFIQMGLLRSLQILLLIIGSGLILILADWKLGMMTMAFMPLIAYRATYIAVALRSKWLIVQTLTGVMITVLQENLAGVRVVRSYGAEKFETAKFERKASEVAKHTVDSGRLQAASSSQMTLAFSVAVVVILWYGGRQVIDGSMTTGELTQFILYMGIMAFPIRMMGWIISTFSRASSAGQRIFEVVDATSPVSEKINATNLEIRDGHVKFEKVCFEYTRDSQAIKNVTFEARSGQMVAIIGSPGSGKTTIANLMSRFYEATSGNISIDSIDIRNVTLESLRKGIGIVQQDVFLFSDTIKANIAYGNPDSQPEDIIRASKLAQLDSFVSTLPEGYDTWIGERGITLSGGQRQRLSIARTILLDPPILILDDSTSSVDAQTEDQLNRGLAELLKERTTFVIANRLKTVNKASLILVMDNGEIAERGTHEHLLSINGLYKKLHDLQMMPDGETSQSSGNGRQA